MKYIVSVFFLSLLSIYGCESKKTSEEAPVKVSEPTKPAKKEIKKVHKGQASVEDGVSAKNALQVAKSIPDFSTLVAAIDAGGVADAVVNAGPLTIFAPTNAAFEKLPKGTVETLLKPENKSKLAFILTNHVAPSNYDMKTLKKNVKKGRKLYMASGKYLEVTREGDEMSVGGTKILKSVKVSNGWIHVVGDVLVPKN